MMKQTFLVAVDGSKAAYTAFQRAVELAKAVQAALTILYVVNDRGYLAERYHDTFLHLVDQETNLATELVADYTEEAQKVGLKQVETKVVYGYPKEQIVALTEQLKFDLLFIGATGNNAFESGKLGSTATYIAQNSHCNVTIIKE
ncbi:universal stress protein [Loigolactobacillus backii]|uniref:Uncharacterized protein n=2 Tax=Loigolactobacillus backii TaxID=375175 RepID=A0A192H2N5_9LACO|nr:universal stress protein [Loigolactobacillus backii]ANK59347.1 hypothetical protein AYR52_03245 [Loigolactobacillus backii]ANK63074.1 hypothetical protein AYR53_10070 [Loigolactobacillus backii]ANK64340.1 hypothetical protein AYR54_03245 [Loigolactobacillus backii]ANK67264.1 hypothetical protein AYR55_05790 [Loigolactobacillus backii]ANK69918.1 hypothetical protein AYR56_06935 [Loigolactobacillus backii]